MRQAAFFLSAIAAAFVIPDEVRSQQISLVENYKDTAETAVQDWWDALPDAENILSRIGERISETILSSHLDKFFTSVNDNDGEEDHPHPPYPPHGGPGHHGPRGDPDKTIYELIKECKHTSKFAKLVDEHEEIKALLQDTKHNHTLFVPTDHVFDRIPHHRHGRHGDDSPDDSDDDDDDHHKPSKEFILAALKYHIAPGLWPFHHIRSHRTIPSSLSPPALGSPKHEDSGAAHHHRAHPQRIRVFTTPFIPLTRLNFHVRLSPHTADFVAKNGLFHPIDGLLIPPPSQTSLVRLLPSHFSTLALALETTGLGDDLEALPRSGGGTFFAPTNRAWERLGPRANAFLFSERGRRYLKALVSYHVVVNETVYSDAYYRGGDGEDDDGAERKRDYWHVDLPSLLGGKPISVDVKTWRGFVSIVVNGFVRVVVRDGVADDGVLQVVDRVLIPPHKHHGGGRRKEDDEGIGEEELKRRLEPYMEEGAGERKDMGDL
ncbi:hypothetical protein VTI74DRAFT_4288 [Chaetomium olivicolor]